MRETYSSTVESPTSSASTEQRPSPLSPNNSNPLQVAFAFEALSQPDTATTPPGVDAAAYAAGQNAAWVRAFQAALPSQQALGQLTKAIDTLHHRIEQDSSVIRELQLDNAKISTTLQSAVGRLDSVEGTQLPNLQSKWEAIATRPAISPDVSEALQQLRTVLVNLSEQQTTLAQQAYSWRLPLASQIQWLMATAAGYTANVLSKADVAALFLSRKILLADIADARQRQQAFVSAALFLGAVEGAWQIHEKARKTPLGRKVLTPFHTGLKIVRVAVWSAAFVYFVHRGKQGCYNVSQQLAKYLPGAVEKQTTKTAELRHRDADGGLNGESTPNNNVLDV